MGSPEIDADYVPYKLSAKNLMATSAQEAGEKNELGGVAKGFSGKIAVMVRSVVVNITHVGGFLPHRWSENLCKEQIVDPIQERHCNPDAGKPCTSARNAQTSSENEHPRDGNKDEARCVEIGNICPGILR
jgi:hypothetical protein